VTLPRWGPVRPGTVLVALAALAGSGCSDGPDSSYEEPFGSLSAAETPRPGGTFTIMLEHPGTLDPLLSDDSYESCLINQLYDGLLEFDDQLNAVPAIAREWIVSSNGKTYTFSLRSDVRFHSGRRLTADDCVYSLTRVLNPAITRHGVGAEYLESIEGAREFAAGERETVTGIEARNDSTLVIRLDEPSALLLPSLAMTATCIVAREEIEAHPDDYDRHAIGTGPFRLALLDDETDEPRIVFEANEEHFRGRPYLDRIVFLVPADYRRELSSQALREGRTSMADAIGPDVSLLASDPRFRVIRQPELALSFLGMNVESGPLQDVRVRQAIAHAVDRSAIAALDPDTRIEAQGILPRGMYGYTPDGRVLKHDPARARALLAEAGHPGGKGLPPIPSWQSNRGDVARIADERIQADLAAVGIRLELHYEEWSEFNERLNEFEAPAFGISWIADIPDPDSFLGALFHSTKLSNMFRYNNAEIDSLLHLGIVMGRSEGRAELYRDVERRILAEAPMVPLYYYVSNYVVLKEVQGIHFSAFGLGSLDMRNIWFRAPAS
jgi:peptide/nickel transport system substrate-binding protein/oligopeptide transport system substrate-binding protein